MNLDELTDAELAQAVLGGNRTAYEVLVRRHQDAVFGLAMSLTRNREDAADMAQEAFIRAYEKLAQYRPERPFRSWLLRICANRTKNLFRSRMRRRNLEEKHTELAATEDPGPDSEHQALEEALRKLPPALGAPLRLKFIEGYSYEEVADVLKIGVSAAKMRALRAKKMLVELLRS